MVTNLNHKGDLDLNLAEMIKLSGMASSWIAASAKRQRMFCPGRRLSGC